MSFFEDSISYNAYLSDILSTLFFNSINKPLTILDFGCGNAILTHFIQKAFCNAKVIGIDNDEQLIKKNKEKYAEIIFLINKGNCIPCDANIFDLLYVVNVIHHIEKKSHQTIINELLRVLKPQGSLIIFEHNPYNWKSRKNFKKEHAKGYNMLSASYLKKLIQRNNITQEIQKSICYLYPEEIFSKITLCKMIPLGQLYYIHVLKK